MTARSSTGTERKLLAMLLIALHELDEICIGECLGCLKHFLLGERGHPPLVNQSAAKETNDARSERFGLGEADLPVGIEKDLAPGIVTQDFSQAPVGTRFLHHSSPDSCGAASGTRHLDGDAGTGPIQPLIPVRPQNETNHCRRRGDESLISFFRVLWTLIRDSSPRLLQWLVRCVRLILKANWNKPAATPSAAELIITASWKASREKMKDEIQGAHDRILLLRRQREAIVAGGVGVEPLFPELIQAATGPDAA
jgi:hypothetical protein